MTLCLTSWHCSPGEGQDEGCRSPSTATRSFTLSLFHEEREPIEAEPTRTQASENYTREGPSSSHRLFLPLPAPLLLQPRDLARHHPHLTRSG